MRRNRKHDGDLRHPLRDVCFSHVYHVGTNGVGEKVERLRLDERDGETNTRQRNIPLRGRLRTIVTVVKIVTVVTVVINVQEFDPCLCQKKDEEVIRSDETNRG